MAPAGPSAGALLLLCVSATEAKAQARYRKGAVQTYTWTGYPTHYPGTGFPTRYPKTGFPIETDFPTYSWETGFPSRYPTSFPSGPSNSPTGFPQGPSGFPTGFPTYSWQTPEPTNSWTAPPTHSWTPSPTTAYPTTSYPTTSYPTSAAPTNSWTAPPTHSWTPSPTTAYPTHHRLPHNQLPHHVLPDLRGSHEHLDCPTHGQLDSQPEPPPHGVSDGQLAGAHDVPHSVAGLCSAVHHPLPHRR
eukprot:TRINITY_DN3136_c0_g1_i10.p2 TRINITY_DN3136_c0_g1~~TRINITY_DN3136_c0_g1_i10.p2  ORF type:complete len:277 (+),score=8.86 TRINITY_DN3136_c0_g1_i10:99-833(+)